MYGLLLAVGVGCLLGNATWALFDRDWGFCAERSFFQLVALVAVAVAYALFPPG